MDRLTSCGGPVSKELQTLTSFFEALSCSERNTILEYVQIRTNRAITDRLAVITSDESRMLELFRDMGDDGRQRTLAASTCLVNGVKKAMASTAPVTARLGLRLAAINGKKTGNDQLGGNHG